MQIDPRILDFRKDHVKLPKRFLLNTIRNIMLSCGSGLKCYDKNITDIEYYSNKNIQINIYCCSNESNNLQLNIDYLISNPELNIVLCLFKNNTTDEHNKLIYLFKNSIDNIGTNDPNFYIPAYITFEIIKNNGTIHDVDLRRYNQEYKDTNKFIIDIKPKKYDGTYRFILLSTLHINCK